MTKIDRRSGKFNRPDGFRLREAETATGIKEWRILAYVKQGFVPTSVQKADGVKQRRAFSLIDIYQLAVVGRLAADGFDLRKAPGKGLDFGGIERDIDFMFRGDYDSEQGVDERAEVEGLWLDRSDEEKVVIIDPSEDFLGSYIPRADLGAEIERVLTEDSGGESRSIYILELHKLLDLVDSRLPTR